MTAATPNEGGTAAVTEETTPLAAFAVALAAFQADIPNIAKDQKAQIKSDKGNFSYDYADLVDITAKVLPLLAKVGLSWSAKPTLAEAGFVLAYSLRHIGGHVETGEYPLPDPARTPAQQLGSAITYARRYCLTAVTGVAPGGDDDDGAKAQDARAAAPARKEHDRMVKDSTASPRRAERVRGEAAKAPDAWTEPVAQPPDTSVEAHTWYAGWAGRVASCPSRPQLKGLWGEMVSEHEAGHATDEMRRDGLALRQERADDLKQPESEPVPA